MDNHEIERKQEIRDLGVLLDRRFAFGHHIEQVTIKCRQIIECIKRYTNENFTKDTQRILYLAYVRSRLEFASTIWNPYVNIYIDDIESIQKQFVIYLLESRRNAPSFRLSPYVDRCKLVGLQSLKNLKKCLIHNRSGLMRNAHWWFHQIESALVWHCITDKYYRKYQLKIPNCNIGSMHK